MASNPQTMAKLLRNLRDNGKVMLQCGALTYIRSNAQKLETATTLTKEERAEICKLVMNMATSANQDIRSEGIKALYSILKFFKSDELKFFDSAMQIKRSCRIELFKFLEGADDSSIVAAAHDPATTIFMEDCLRSIKTSTMPWLLPTSCSDNLQMLVEAENASISESDELEMVIVNKALALLQRFCKMVLNNSANIESLDKFDPLVIDKVMKLAYLGHKKQREPAIHMLNQAIDTELGSRLKTKYPDVWLKYKNDLQSSYTGRMTLLVKACEHNWSNLWCISIKLLGTELHRGATMINNLLSVEEKAFKSTDTVVRRDAFVSWKLLIDNFALDIRELATPRRVKLLCVPLTAKNSKSELIALTKLEVWWYLIVKIYENITKFADPVVTQFLNFCFGPLGDTPLLSSTFDVIASPGKKFYKTKLIAIDALLQMLVFQQKDRIFFAPILQERLPRSISEMLFKEFHKTFLHSVGEAVILVSQLQANELRHREEICKVLWTNLMHYVRTTNSESKSVVYKEVLLLVKELLIRAADVSFVNAFIREVIMPELAAVTSELIYHDKTLVDLMTQLMVPSILRNLQAKQCDAMKSLMWQTVRPQAQSNDYHPEILKFLHSTLNNLRCVPLDDNTLTDCFELWFVHADIAYKYMKAPQRINEGTDSEPDFKTIESIIIFPLTHMHWANSLQAQRIAAQWKNVYKKFESQADSLLTIKNNQVLERTSMMIADCLSKNEKCYRITVYCLDALLSTINYKFLLTQNQIPSIVRIVGELTTIALHEGSPAEAECSLKAFSSLLITVYGHSSEKSLFYMQATSKTVEMMLKMDAEDRLLKEITSTWETIVSILRGLCNQLDSGFLLSYKEIILLSLKHANPEISFQTRKVLEMKENMKESARLVLVELVQESGIQPTRKDTPKTKVDKNDRTAKQTRITGSFLNRKIPSPKPTSAKARDKDERKIGPLPPEPDSQDYVLIKSDVKVDVNRLTEHQKESFKRRRDDIPAMYNDLSQSSSQDTQDLQKWFGGKKNDAKVSSDTEKSCNTPETTRLDDKIEEIVSTSEEKIINEPIITNETTENIVELSIPETMPSSAQDPNIESVSIELTCEKSISEDKGQMGNTNNPSDNMTPASDDSYVTGTKSPQIDSPSNETTDVSKKLNFESRDEYPEANKNMDEDKSPSLITSSGKTNRGLRSGKNVGASQTDEKTPKTVGRIRAKSTVTEGESVSSEMSEERNEILAKSKDKAKSSTMTRSQTSVSVERGTKRKAVSDSENEANERETRRRKMSRSRSRTPENSENSTLSSKQRRRECEMSRLRIDMVFEPIPSKRRSKYSEDFVSTDTIGKRQPSPKSTRAKTAKLENSLNSCSSTNSKPRRSSRGIEKDVAPDPAKKRKKTTKEPENAEVENQTTKTAGKSGRSKKNLPETGSASESQIIVDDEENPENSTMNVDSEKSMNIAISETQTNVGLTENVSSPKISELPLAIITEVPLMETSELATVATGDVTMENDLDEVVESSQDSTVFTGGHKRSFAKIVKSKIANDPPRNHTLEISMEKKQPRASSPICPEGVAIADNNEVAIDKNILEDADETFLDISAIRPQLADDVPCEDAEKKVPEASKTSASPVPMRANEVNFNFSSPKGSSKRFVKSRSFAPQGRAAHMLGLVTKLATMEKDVEKNPIEDDSAVTTKRTKNREIDDKRSSITKEAERIGSPGGSRQEKIFNNMKAVDYAASPPGKLFGNLRNDGEKVSPKMEKFHSNDNDNDSSRTKDDDNVSGISEKDELPILEWSSANPPSLTASPSASILKRNRSIVNETDIDQSNKLTRKRVSFADPPVSKEMGYEIEASSPHKVNKLGTPRGLLGRRDSPIRIKQSRFKMIQIDPEKTERDEEPRNLSSISDLDVECARDNELLMKIAEDLEETVDLQTPEKIESNEYFGASMRNEINDEFAINDIDTSKQVQDDITTQETEEKSEKIGPTVKVINAEEAPTQDDLFNSSDEKVDSPKIDRSIVISEKFNDSEQSSAMDSFKLNVTDDSVIGNITDSYGEDAEKSESLEDTIDVRNVTNLNMTTNSDEGLDERPPQTSNQGGDSVSQMDTLTITESILASLPISQDSQGPSQVQVEIPRPELLNSTEPIYPTLTECQKSIDDLIPDLADQLWRRNLAKNMETRGIRTIGDLARLSEREIARIPVKGSSKIDFVRKVLAKYEKRLRDSEDKVADNNDEGAERLAVFPVVKSTTTVTEDLELPQEIQKSLGDISLLASSLKLNSNLVIFDVSTPATRIPDCSVSDVDFDPHARHTLGRTSTGISGLTINLDPTVCTVLEDTSNVSQISTINLSSDTIPLTTNSVGTCTDPPPKISTNSVALQTIDEDLLDEIEGCPKGTARRSRAEKLLKDYKVKMQSPSDLELTEDTMRLLEIDAETMLKVACRECGLDKVFCNLPDIFESEKQFYPKLLSAYRNKIKISHCMELHEHEDIKKEICKRCSSAELLEMLSRTLKDEEQRDVKTPINEATSLSGILRRLPINLISETIGNNELVPSSVVLDVGLQKNDPEIVTKKLETEYPEIMKNLFDRRIATLSREELLSVNQAIAAKLSPQDLLDSFNTAMKMKLNENS